MRAWTAAKTRVLIMAPPHAYLSRRPPSSGAGLLPPATATVGLVCRQEAARIGALRILQHSTRHSRAFVRTQ